MTNGPIIVGISGGSGSGKSWLAQKIQSEFPGQTTIIEQDWYYHDLSGIPLEEAEKTNFDAPSAIEQSLLYHHLSLLAQGRSINAPNYCYATYSRLEKPQTLKPRKIVVLEGIFALYWSQIRSLLQTKIYINASPEIRLARRLVRDSRERGFAEEQIRKSWVQNALPMHSQFVAPTARYADIVLESQTDSPFEKSFLADLRKRLGNNGNKSK